MINHTDERPLAERLTSLVRSADPKLTVNPHVIQRCLKRFSAQTSLYLSAQDKTQAKLLYEETADLPQTDTEQALAVDGYQINKSLSINNDTLVICFNQNSVPCVLKTLNRSESERISEIPQLDSNYIIKYALRESVRKNPLMIMPLLPATLEHIGQLSQRESTKLWTQMSNALSCLHQYRLAHMDVKPSNIGLNHDGDFILITLNDWVLEFSSRKMTIAFL